MTTIQFLGSCREVGRSAILIEANNGAQCILDYGVRFSEEERLPHEVNLDNLKAVALTHCHVDHSGALPYLYKFSNVPFYTNAVSLRVTEVLLRDMKKISDYPYPFGFKEINKLLAAAIYLPNRTRQKIDKNFYITFYDAGHIPGGVSIYVEVDDKKILYTGDINTQSTHLIHPANSLDIPEVDVLIIESTYSLREHPSRKTLEVKFVKHVKNIIDNGGTVLVPAFGVARSQEALLILNKHKYDGKIFIDGMAREISRLYMDYPESLKNINTYRKAVGKAHFISVKKPRKDRSIAKRSNGVIIAPSGMLKGGTAIDYSKTILEDPNSAIYLVGYQVEGSTGRKLLEKGVFEYTERSRNNNSVRDLNIKSQCDVEYFDFSSHADGIHLHNYINNIKFQNGSNYVFCVHGDSKSTTTLANDLAKKSYTSVAPETGESYKI